jgi:hypothetical protein
MISWRASAADEDVDYPRYLLRLAELGMIERERRTVERRIKEARFPAVKSLDHRLQQYDRSAGKYRVSDYCGWLAFTE